MWHDPATDYDERAHAHLDVRIELAVLHSLELWPRRSSCRSGRCALLHLYVRFLHHLAPLLKFGQEEPAGLCRAHLHDLRAVLGELILHLAGVQHRRDLPAEPVDDRLWRAGGDRNAPLVARLVAWH